MKTYELGPNSKIWQIGHLDLVVMSIDGKWWEKKKARVELNRRLEMASWSRNQMCFSWFFT